MIPMIQEPPLRDKSVLGGCRLSPHNLDDAGPSHSGELPCAAARALQLFLGRPPTLWLREGVIDGGRLPRLTPEGPPERLLSGGGRGRRGPLLSAFVLRIGIACDPLGSDFPFGLVLRRSAEFLLIADNCVLRELMTSVAGGTWQGQGQKSSFF